MVFFVSAVSDLDYLHAVAHRVVDAARVMPGETIEGGGKNTTGVVLRVPGGTRNYYPAFWVRDAAMMLGSDLVPADELRGWIKVIMSVQAGPSGLAFDHGLVIPPYSIPDHITLDGRACWFPGAYADQGVGNYGHLPPADDAFFFVGMVAELRRLGETPTPEMVDAAKRAFESVETDSATGLVVCSEDPARDRVDWGFCDSIKKSGLCLMPSLLRWQAAKQLSRLTGLRSFGKVADQIRSSVVSTFLQPVDGRESLLLSATGVGRKDDVWAGAFAVWLHLLPRPIELKVARHLLNLYLHGDVAAEGQFLEVPPRGEFGGHWEKAGSGPKDYQNGGYWATPTGWYVAALREVDRPTADKLLGEYVRFLRENEAKGASFEWINPMTGVMRNPLYGSSAGLVYTALAVAGSH